MSTSAHKPQNRTRPAAQRARVAGLALFCLLLAACLPSWETTVVAPDGSAYVVNAARLRELSEYVDEDEGQEGVLLEQVLWDAGHAAIAQLALLKPDGTRVLLDWPDAADAGLEWRKNGQLDLNGQAARVALSEVDLTEVARIEVQPTALFSQVQASITDLAPTAAAALGLPAPAQAAGQALDVPSAKHVLLLFLDAFGYQRYTQALDQGDIPTLAGLEAPLLAVTTYPPVTCVSSASLLTGAPPQVHGAIRRGFRKTEVETLFDVAAAAGREVAAIEGDALAFQLRGAEWKLSGDRDGNGSTDDNVLVNSLALLAEGMPDLLLVHFHGIDDTGHTYGPGAPEERAAVRDVDAAVGEILNALPEETLVLIFADHGMHPVQEEGRLGNHGQVVCRDRHALRIVPRIDKDGIPRYGSIYGCLDGGIRFAITHFQCAPISTDGCW